MEEKYLTVSEMGQAEIVEKRSRFIATVKPVTSEGEALEFLSDMRQKYWDAKHNVYAYIIRNNNISRFSDDKEPSGTAGKPVLDVLQKSGLCDTAIVVTRYFGGILLGTGGLVRAYSSAASEGVRAAKVCEMVLCKELRLTVDYTNLGTLQNEIAKKNAISGEAEYSDKVSLSVFLPSSNIENFKADITDRLCGKISIEERNEEYRKVLAL